MHKTGRTLRSLAIGAGIGWSLAFLIVGIGFGLQLYGDGAIFTYSITIEDSWAFHAHNIPGRVWVYLMAALPAEFVVHLTRSADAGIATYGVLFFAAPGLGLLGTWMADRTPRRIFFSYACAATACFCPLVFGFPTEMWMAHALFWPTLTLVHCAPRRTGGSVAVAPAMLALTFTHEGAWVLAAVILATLALRGWRDPLFFRGTLAIAVAFAAWLTVKIMLPPDAYIADVLDRAALAFFDPDRLVGSGLLRLLAATLLGYLGIFMLLERRAPVGAAPAALVIVAAALLVYWLVFDRALHADNRYYLRTALLLGTAGFGVAAAAQVMLEARQLAVQIPYMPRLFAILSLPASRHAAAGALLLVTLVHAVETAKFVAGWTSYKAAIRTLATGTAADPSLGDPRFVSAARIDLMLKDLSWNSTTPYLSVLLAPGHAPSRLVVDPGTGYFWLSCATAIASATADRAIPVASRELIRTYSCLHR